MATGERIEVATTGNGEDGETQGAPSSARSIYHMLHLIVGTILAIAAAVVM